MTAIKEEPYLIEILKYQEKLIQHPPQKAGRHLYLKGSAQSQELCSTRQFDMSYLGGNISNCAKIYLLEWSTLFHIILFKKTLLFKISALCNNLN
jgi:hypothetical protein